MYMHVYGHTCTCTFACMCTCACMTVYVCVHVCTRIGIGVCAHELAKAYSGDLLVLGGKTDLASRFLDAYGMLL